VNYTFKATNTFWKEFYALSSEQKASTREAWEIFKQDPFDSRLGAHEIRALSGRAGRTIWSAKIERNLRVIFCIDGSVVITLDIGTHDIYK
jgi:hypothetical protein